MENTNELLGEVRCLTPLCGKPMNVYRNKKKKLYGRCPACGCQQQTGKPMQDYFASYVPVGSLEDAEPGKVEAMEDAAEAVADAIEENIDISPGQDDQPKSKAGLVVLGGGLLAVVGLMLGRA